MWSLGCAGSVPLYLVLVSEEVFAFCLSLPLLPLHLKSSPGPNQGTYCTESRENGASKWTVQAYCVLDHDGRDLCMGFGIFPFILMHTATSDLIFLNGAVLMNHGDGLASARFSMQSANGQTEESTSGVVIALEMFQPYGFSRPLY